MEKVGSAKLPTKYGDFTVHGFKGPDGEEIIVLTRGDVGGDDVLVRVHSACLTGDVLHSRRCDCGNQLEMSIRQVVEEDRGMIIYLYGHEGRGIGILNKIKAYALQDKGMDTVDANLELGFESDLRDYSIIPDVLTYFRVNSIRLLTNNPEKIKGLDNGKIKIKRVPIVIPPDKVNESYMETKRNRMGHLFS